MKRGLNLSVLASVFLMTHCATSFILPEQSTYPIESSVNVYQDGLFNELALANMSIRIPVNWSFNTTDLSFLRSSKAIEADSGIRIRFQSAWMTQGYFSIQPIKSSIKKDQYTIVKNYLKQQKFSTVYWIRPTTGVKGWVVKGKLMHPERSIGGLQKRKKHFDAYMAFWFTPSFLYRLVVMSADGTPAIFDVNTMKLIQSFSIEQINDNNTKKNHKFESFVWKRLGIPFPSMDEWKIYTSYLPNVFHLSHQQLPLSVYISFLGKINYSSEYKRYVDDDVQQVMTDLGKLKYSYSSLFYENEKIQGQSTSLFHLFRLKPVTNNSSKTFFENKRYYFRHRDRAYSLSVLYYEDAWSDEMQEQLISLMRRLDLWSF